MNNKPVAWAIKVGKDLIEIVDENRDFQELVDFYKLEQWDFEEVSLYTQEQLEEARKLGMQQERALWNLSESTQEFESFDRTASHMAGEYVAHPVKEQELLAEIEALKKQVVIWERSSKDRAIKLNICAIKVSQLEKELSKYPQQGSSIPCKYTEGI